MNTLTDQLKDAQDLDEKLRLIDEMMAKMTEATPKVVGGKVVVADDPMTALWCDSCQ